MSGRRTRFETSKDENKEDKFDKDENIRLYQTLKVGTSLNFLGVDAQVVEGPTLIVRTTSTGEVVNDYRIKVKARASTASLRSDYLDASLHRIKLLDDGPVYEVIFTL